ncbi:MAG: hypothetical protein ACSLE0_05590 [Chitinophagaceae bacterium]
MMEDIAPAIPSSKPIQLLTIKQDASTRDLVFDSHISFLPFINFLKSRSVSSTGTRGKFYKYLVERFESEPALLGPDIDSSMLSDHSDLLELLGTSLFPLISESEKNIYTLALPYQFSIFSDSSLFRKLFVKNDEHFILPENVSEKRLKQIHSALIYEHALEKFYGIKLNANTNLVYTITDAGTGMKQYYKLRYDRRFIDLQLKGALPPIQNCAVCLNTFRILDLDQQLKTMPLELFSAEGFGVWVAEDVTLQESLESVKKILLRQETCDTSIISEIKENIHALVGLNEVEVGLMPYVKLNGEFVLDEKCTQHGLMGKTWKANDEESMQLYRGSIEFLSERPEPMPIPILNEQITKFAPFLRKLWEEGMRSYLIYPVRNIDGFLGLVELASPIPNQLTSDVMARLEPAMPLISLALLKNKDAFNTKIERLIKEKFTALQPSVEWKFARSAWEYMNGLDENSSIAKTQNVEFEGVYPLYGAVDIRNSSVQRSMTIQKDLKAHLNLIDEVLDKLQPLMKLPLLEELKFKNQNFRDTIEKDTMQAEDEVRINEFFENEVTPVFQHLQKGGNQVRDIADKYFEIVSDNNSYLYRYRNEYESTLTTINEVVLQYLEKEEESLQQSYPHYFEKYKTDGVEYNIYIGQSICPNNEFDLLYLKNIRLWQLRSMAEIARLTYKLVPSLAVPLQTTQLLLIHSQPITISFRRDERRFDVEGSYNIRYEVMKKRLDKVCIKETHERLTQPGKIAMVYSNPKEAQEYQEYIFFLQSKNVLNPGFENLELEELQGVSGLKALRVEINLKENE